MKVQLLALGFLIGATFAPDLETFTGKQQLLQIRPLGSNQF
jgi:hypothetical protein